MGTTAKGIYKLNVDDSCFGNPRRNKGRGILQIDNDHFVAVFSKNYAIATNNIVEIRALVDGIELCESLGFKRVEVKTNSNLLVHWWAIKFRFLAGLQSVRSNENENHRFRDNY